MKEPPVFGAGQLFLLVFLSRVVITLTYGISAGGHTVNNADWLSALLFPPILLLMAIPTFLFLKRSGNRDICSYSYSLSRGLGHGVSVIYALWFLIQAFAPVARFSYFVTSSMQPEQGVWFFPLLILMPVCFAAIRGIQAIVRTGAILTAVSILSIVAIILALLPRFDMLNIYTPLYDGWNEVGNSLTLMTSNSLELGMVLMLAPQVKGNVKKAYLGYAFAVPLTLFFIQFTVVAVLGSYADLQLFPFYSVAGIAKIGELTNLSALVASVWIVGVFIKSATYLYLCFRCLSNIVPMRFRTIAIILFSGVAAVLAVLTSDSVRTIRMNFSMVGSLVAQGIFMFLVPFLLVLIGVMKRRVPIEKNPESAH